MTKRTRNSFIASVILTTLLSIGIGCGHPPKPSPSPTPTPVATPPSPTPSPVPQASAAPAMSFSKVRGMHVQAASVKTVTSVKWHWFSLPTVEAATIVSVQQNWEGDCQSSPPTTGSTSSIVLFGVGQTVDETCSHSWFDNDLDGSKAAGFNTTGKIVYGDGTLSNLVVSVEKGTVLMGTAHVTVWVKRGLDVLATGITCDLSPGNDEQICQSATKFATQNLDRVLVTITRSDGDSLVNLNAAFTKSIP